MTSHKNYDLYLPNDFDKRDNRHLYQFEYLSASSRREFNFNYFPSKYFIRSQTSLQMESKCLPIGWREILSVFTHVAVLTEKFLSETNSIQPYFEFHSQEQKILIVLSTICLGSILFNLQLFKYYCSQWNTWPRICYFRSIFLRIFWNKWLFFHPNIIPEINFFIIPEDLV